MVSFTARDAMSTGCATRKGFLQRKAKFACLARQRCFTCRARLGQKPFTRPCPDCRASVHAQALTGTRLASVYERPAGRKHRYSAERREQPHHAERPTSTKST